MLFTDELNKYAYLGKFMEKLVNLAFENQTHDGDLLLWLNNGFYTDSYNGFKTSSGKQLNPHVIGPGEIGHSEDAHYRFINQYRQAYLSKISYNDYIKQLEWSPERRKEIDELTGFEETTINLEMLVYLKFWEADSIIKKFYELVRIAHGEHYDWYFKIQESNRDLEATGSRQDIVLKKIRNRLENQIPELFSAFKTAYKTQVRNAVAHSKYSFQGRYIHLHNYVKEDKHAQLKSISFDEWIEIFHITIVLHNEYITATNYIASIYRDLAIKNNCELPIRVTEKSGRSYELPLIYRTEFADWHYKQD